MENMAHALANVLNQERLHIRIWQEDGVYIARCLDVPGCVSEGSTRDEVLANIRDAVALCLDVIREDNAAGASSTAQEVEIVECPISEFMGAR
jgi:predicted RNase H-like HicB family nuclease